jgi:hypothetical protein
VLIQKWSARVGVITLFFVSFLDAFAKLLKVTFRFVISVHLSVCASVRMEQFGFHWMDFHEI